MNEIILFGQSTSYLEIAGMVTGLGGVYLTIRQSRWCFPVGIVNVAIYAYLFFSPGIQLYADALLQCIYILLLLYGWYNWTSNKNFIETTVPIKLEKKIAVRLFFIVAVATCILALFFSNYTNASFPWLDSALTCSSLAAQWMIAKKHIENWIVWIAVDMIYIPLFLVKHLPLTAILYAVFTWMAISGYREWKMHMRHE